MIGPTWTCIASELMPIEHESSLSMNMDYREFEVRCWLVPQTQVHLSTHDPINKNTAKASLQQMLSVVFSRMELKDNKLKEVMVNFYSKREIMRIAPKRMMEDIMCYERRCSVHCCT